jgi:large subunit ribosomal protein L25
MELKTFKVATRESSGKGPARQSRLRGEVPGIVYGGGKDACQVTVNLRDLEKLVHGDMGERAFLELDVTDNQALNGPSILKSIQHHPVRGQIVHVDFLRIDMNKPIRMMVPIELSGRCPGVIEGGIIENHQRELEVEFLPTDVPEKIEIDTSTCACPRTYRKKLKLTHLRGILVFQFTFQICLSR